MGQRPRTQGPERQKGKLDAFRAGHSPKTIVIDGVQWEYIACGQGQSALLLLNGGLRIAETAFAYVELFESDCRVLVPTYPPLRSVDDLTDGIVAILDAEHVQDELLLGQSYGGMVAQVMVQRFPKRVTKLVLSGAGPLSPPKAQRAILKLILAVAPLLPEKTVKNVYKKSISQVLSIPGDRRDFWQAYLDHLFDERLTKADVLSHFRTGEDTLDKYAYGMQDPWPGDVLVLGGENDPVSSDQDRSEIVAYYPNTTLKVIGGAGHTIAMQRPDEFAKSIKSFFDDK
jgi:pimeloyl-ACP methyl ester carboxylesterase